MSSHPLDRTHPVRAFTRQLTVRLDQLAPTAVWSMSPADQRETLIELARAKSQLAALELRVLAEADRSGATDTEAACSAADWLAVETQQVRRVVRSDLHLARALEGHNHLTEAMSQGEVNVSQARAITHALDRLPESGEFAVTDADRARAEAHLVALAADHDAKELAVLGRKVFEVIAPEVAEEFEGKALADQEAAALRRVMFTMREDDEGTVHGRFRIPVLHGHMLQTFLLAIASPARAQSGADAANNGADVDQGEGVAGPGAADGLLERTSSQGGPCSGIDSGLPPSVRQGLAFCQLLEAIPAKDLPTAGGCSATIVVTMTLRDKGCTATGCDRPPSMCHAHHDHPWVHHGDTDVATGRLLCGHHHRRIHDSHYEHRVEPDGRCL